MLCKLANSAVGIHSLKGHYIKKHIKNIINEEHVQKVFVQTYQSITYRLI